MAIFVMGAFAWYKFYYEPNKAPELPFEEAVELAKEKHEASKKKIRDRALRDVKYVEKLIVRAIEKGIEYIQYEKFIHQPYEYYQTISNNLKVKNHIKSELDDHFKKYYKLEIWTNTKNEK